MKNFKAVLVFMSLLLSGESFAYTPSEGKISAIFGPFLYKTDAKPSDTGSKSPWMSDFALIAQGDVNDTGSLEIAMFHMNKFFQRDEGGKTIAEMSQVFHVTMGYRWWFGPKFSFSPAFYSAYAMDEPTVIHSDFVPGKEIDTSARDTTEYGFDFSAESELWAKDQYSVILDARYSLSVTNKAGENSNHYGIVLGLKYLVQEK